MCDSRGCVPSDACAAPVEDAICFICGEKPDDCACEPLDEELNYEEEEELEEEEEEEENEDDDDDEDDEEW